MSKITMSTDWHFGKSNGRFDRIILDGIKAQCEHAKMHKIKTLINHTVLRADTMEKL